MPTAVEKGRLHTLAVKSQLWDDCGRRMSSSSHPLSSSPCPSNLPDMAFIVSLYSSLGDWHGDCGGRDSLSGSELEKGPPTRCFACPIVTSFGSDITRCRGVSCTRVGVGLTAIDSRGPGTPGSLDAFSAGSPVPVSVEETKTKT